MLYKYIYICTYLYLLHELRDIVWRKSKKPKNMATLDPHRSPPCDTYDEKCHELLQSLDQQNEACWKTHGFLRSCTWLAAEQLVHCNLISSCHPGLIKVRTPMIRILLGSWHTGWSFLGEFTRWRNLKWKKHNHITIENGGLSMCFLLECWYMDSMQVTTRERVPFYVTTQYVLHLCHYAPAARVLDEAHLGLPVVWDSPQ